MEIGLIFQSFLGMLFPIDIGFVGIGLLHHLIVSNLFFYPECDLVKDNKGVEFIIGLYGIDGFSDFLYASEYFEYILVEFVVGGEFVVVEEDVVEHFFVGVVLFEFVKGLHELLLVLGATLVPLAVDRDYDLTEVEELGL